MYGNHKQITELSRALRQQNTMWQNTVKLGEKSLLYLRQWPLWQMGWERNNTYFIHFLSASNSRKPDLSPSE